MLRHRLSARCSPTHPVVLPASRPRRWWLALAVVMAFAASGCNVTANENAQVKPRAHALEVVASAWPLASIASYIGQGQVAAIDLTTPGVDPAHLVPTARQRGEIRRAGLVLDVGGSYQPAVEAAARGNRRVLAVWPALGGNDPEVWLQPDLMMKAATLVGNALAKADPAHASTYRNGVRAFRSTVSSVNIDYTNNLSDCGHKTIVTPDRAFAGLAKEYGLVDVAAGTDPVSRLAALVQARQLHVVYREPLVDSSAIAAVAKAAHVRVYSLDTMAAEPAGGWPAPDSYDQLMEANLARLTNGLDCEAMGGSTL